MTSKSRIILNSFARHLSQQSGPTNTNGPIPGGTGPINTSVPGLSESVVFNPKEPVGPGVEPSKSGNYKVPEYFCYNTMSYYEAEIEMSKFRLPQPSSKPKSNN